MTLIVEKMKEHLLTFLEDNELDIIKDVNSNNSIVDFRYVKGKVDLETFNEVVGNYKWQYPWLYLKNPTASHYNLEVLTSFLNNEDNYQLFLTNFNDLGFDVTRQVDPISKRITDKKILINFLQNFKYKNKIPSYQVNSIGQILDTHLVGSTEENIKITNNFLENTNGSYGASKVKIILKKYLVEKLGEAAANSLSKFWEIKLKSDSLLYDIKDNKVLTYFINIAIIINNQNLENARSKKSYETLLKEICKVVGAYFNIKQIAAADFDKQLYTIVAIVPQSFEEDLSQLWEPLIEQYITLSNNKQNPKKDLIPFLKNYTLSLKLNKELPDKVEVRKTNKI